MKNRDRKYFPLHCHSHYSILDGRSKPEDIADRIEYLGLEGCALTDHGTISGCVKFIKEIQNKKLKPIIGCELYLCDKDASIQDETNKRLLHLPILAKNDIGWKQLLKIISISNRKENYYYKPRLSLEQLADFCDGNIIAFSGHLGSQIANAIQTNNTLSKKTGIQLAEKYREIFGKDNFFLEVQLMDMQNNPEMKRVADVVREISKTTKIPCIATADSHYASKSDAEDQRILLCSNMNTTMEKAQDPDFPLSSFFKSSQYHIPSYEEMLQWHTQDELENTLVVADMVEDYNTILSKPILPEFNCPDNLGVDEYLRHLCRLGWKDKIENKISSEQKEEYANRVKYELEVLQSCGLSAYFLIVRDIIQFVKNNNWLPGVGRGSSSGCLVSYLLGITGIDPIEYGLIFERFYNKGRNTENRVSMPDIDIDVPKYSRKYVIDYIKDKYGHDKVGQMITYQTLKGRGALKAVLRAYDEISFGEMNEITKNIVEEHKISDELQEMKESTGDSSIIRWCLENTPKKLENWCYLNDKDELDGPYAKYFKQAIRLEGVKSASSIHPAGIVITPKPLSEICPVVWDSKNKDYMVGLEMDDTEDVGGIKFDILGVALLDKVMGVKSKLENGDIYEIQIS